MNELTLRYACEFYLLSCTQILIGVGGEDTQPRVYADIVIDELELWTASKDKLVAYNFVQRGKNGRRRVSIAKEKK